MLKMPAIAQPFRAVAANHFNYGHLIGHVVQNFRHQLDQAQIAHGMIGLTDQF